MNEKIIRRIASSTRFEYYQLEFTPPKDMNLPAYKDYLDLIEAKVAIIRPIIGEPPQETAQTQNSTTKEKPKAPTEFTYWTEGSDIIFSVPFKQKDPFKDLVKDISGRWPSWIEDRLLWKLEEGLFSVKLQTQIVEQFMGGKA